MKKAFISILFLFFIKAAVAQYIPGDDECYIVLEKLKQNLKNDSLVVDFFVKNYTIRGKRITINKKMTSAQFIKFYQKKENKHLYCTFKRFGDTNVLLDDPTKDK